jgi:hypothetical protein
LLRLSAIISQYFFTAAICPMRRAVWLWLVFPVPADVRDMSESHDYPGAVFAFRRFAQVRAHKQFVQVASVCGDDDCIISPNRATAPLHAATVCRS